MRNLFLLVTTMLALSIKAYGMPGETPPGIELPILRFERPFAMYSEKLDFDIRSHNSCQYRFLRETRAQKRFFLDAGRQMGKISSIFAGAGMAVKPGTFLMLSYGVGRDEYDSQHVIPFCRECVFYFHELWVGGGKEFFRPISLGTGLTLHTNIWLGTEFVPNKGILHDNDTPIILSPAFKPEILIGYYFKKAELFIGASYQVWLPKAMTLGRQPLVNPVNGEQLIWGQDLFPGRSGLNFLSGMRYAIF